MEVQNPVAVVVNVRHGSDGQWTVAVDGTLTPVSAALVPAQFVLRLWRGEGGVFRGTIQRPEGDGIAPFQCNEQLLELFTHWLGFSAEG